MPISVPKEPKVYTTKYDNFRGVDFTNDPSNIWRHRSPNAKNMTPDLSGRPWKRTGWEIIEDTQAFKDCYNTTKGYTDTDPEYFTGRITPIKTSYFEYGGEDFLAISNNLGLFFYSKFIGTAAQDEPYLMFINKYYGEVGQADENTSYTKVIRPDANRGFFFEGQGTAGFYIFCTIEGAGTPPSLETALFRFDGQKLRRTVPYVPTIVIGKDPGDGASTFYENPNLLTMQRIVMFHGDGSSKDFVLPEKADTNLAFKVEVLVGGTWTTKTNPTDYSTSDYNYGGQTVTKISFTNAPASSTEDNVRVTYSAIGSAVTQNTYTGTSRVGKGVRTTQTRTLTYVDGALTTTTPWQDGATSNWIRYGLFTVPNIVYENNRPKVDVYMKTDADTWTVSPILASKVDLTYTAYDSSLQVRVPNPSGYYYSESTEYSSITQVSSNVVITGGSGSSGGEIHAAGIPQQKITTVVEQRYRTTWKNYPIKIEATNRLYSSSPERSAFEQCIRATVYGDGIINSVFLTGSSADNYRSRVWWSAPTDPTYFPDTNYFEAGSNDTSVAGLMKVGEYLGVIKQGQTMDSTIYLAYQTKIASGSITTDSGTETTYDDTFAIKSSIGGIGAVSNGAFNILNGEPLFLAREGIMGIEPRNENEKQVRNRSFFINKRLKEEGDLESAFSFVWRNMYILAINNRCYVLDGSQKSSWANEKTNLQYEAYYWDNVPAQCFARYNNELWFTDPDGRLCRFKPEGEPSSYHDDYDSTVLLENETTMYGYIPYSIVVSDPDIKVTLDIATFRTMCPDTGQYVFSLTSAGYLHRTLLGHDFGNAGHLDQNVSIGGNSRSGDSIMTYLHNSEGWHINGEVADLDDYGITIEGIPKLNDTISIQIGAPILARWTTVLDDDGSAHYFKTLQKKGTMVVLYPQSSTGVRVYIKKDNEQEQYIGTATVRNTDNEITAPSDFYLKKKAKKYKRLQIIAENDGYDETFGIDEIIKCYTIGNYSRNR